MANIAVERKALEILESTFVTFRYSALKYRT